MASSDSRGRWGTIAVTCFMALLIASGAFLLWWGTHQPVEPIVAPLPEKEFTLADPDEPQQEHCDPLEFASVHPGSFVSVPCIGIDAPLMQTGAKDGWLTLPEPPWATWYERTQPVGSDVGHSLIASHVDHGRGQEAPFYQLHRIAKGDSILVRDRAGKIYHYRAVSMKVYERETVPSALFSPVGDPTLVLVTCSGPTIDAGEAPFYMYNLVVTAALVGEVSS